VLLIGETPQRTSDQPEVDAHSPRALNPRYDRGMKVRQTQMNIGEAKTHFAVLLARAEQGEEVVIARAGRPIAKLVAATNVVRRRPLGTAHGQVAIAADFKAPLPKELRKAFGE
jgi:prevent-host-death family protein